MNLVKYLILFLFLLLPVKQLKAQYPFSKKIDIEEENLTLKATTLIKDHLGFIWIGTSNGVYKYNAAIPENMTEDLKNKPYVTALFEDAAGIIWAGCKNGRIINIKDHQVSFFYPEEGLPKVEITSICQDIKKRIWFGSGGEGIYCYDNIHLYNFNSKDGLSEDYINCLYSNNGSEIIAGTDRGLSFINFENGKKNIAIFTSKDGLPDNIVTCISGTKRKNIFLVGTQSKGIHYFSGSNRQMIDDSVTNRQWVFGQVNDIIDSKDEIYIATEQDGIIGYDKIQNRFVDQLLQDSLFPKRVAALQKDNEGNIWAASENKLVSFTDNYLKFWYAAKTVNYLKVHCIFADEENKLWFTPDMGLYETTPDNLGSGLLKRFYLTPSDNNIDITGIYKDRYGFLWIGTMGEGLFRMDTETGKCRRISENPIAYYGNILSVTGKDNQVWISTLNGVVKFSLNERNYDLKEKINFENYNKKDGLGSDYIYQILIDSKNRVWFATDGAGVTVLDNGMFLNFYSNRFFPSKVTYSLTEDKNKHIWVSTYNDGLFEYDGVKFIQYGLKDGLTDLAITSIAVDDYNNIIAVNKKGIDVFNPQLKIAQHYGSESGFSEQQPNLNSIAKGKDGKIWIGTNNGIVCLNTHPSFSTFIPIAVIENIKLFNKIIDPEPERKFEYNQNSFSFNLAAAYYKASEKIRFQYWLEGYSKNWETTSDRVLNFPQLHPGKYKLKIRASANDNFDAAPIAVYSFKILKSLWTTWWFIILAGTIILFTAFWLFRQRITTIRKAEHSEREKIQLQYDALKNQVNPHFLFNSFNALMNIVEDDPKEAALLIKHLSQFYRKMTAYSEQELISFEEELELLNSYLFIQKKRYGAALQVEINIDPELKRSALLPPLVLQLLTENAVKHNSISKEKPLNINIFTENDRIVVSNNINFKLEKEESEGVGLQNIKNRYKILTDKEIILIHSPAEFIIKLPII